MSPNPAYTAQNAMIANAMQNAASTYNQLLGTTIAGSDAASRREMGLGTLGLDMAKLGLEREKFQETKSPDAIRQQAVLAALAQGGLPQALQTSQSIAYSSPALGAADSSRHREVSRRRLALSPRNPAARSSQACSN